jgi:hypothetical protein
MLSEAGPRATDRIHSLHLQAFGRPPTPTEIQTLLDLLALQTRSLNPPDGGADGELRLWTEICHALFLTQEFAHVP